MWMLVGTQRGEDRVEVRDRGNGIRSLQWDRGCVERLERSRDHYFVVPPPPPPPGLYRVVHFTSSLVWYRIVSIARDTIP